MADGIAISSKHSASNARVTAVDENGFALDHEGKGGNWNATHHDVREMADFGIEPAFKRRFKFIAMVGFASTVRSL